MYGCAGVPVYWTIGWDEQVKLGLLPGWGGTQLLHPLVGLQGALDMILTGEEAKRSKCWKA